MSRLVLKPLIFRVCYASVRNECIDTYAVRLHFLSCSDEVNLPLILAFSLSIDVIRAWLRFYLLRLGIGACHQRTIPRK